MIGAEEGAAFVRKASNSDPLDAGNLLDRFLDLGRLHAAEELRPQSASSKGSSACPRPGAHKRALALLEALESSGGGQPSILAALAKFAGTAA